MQMLVLPDYPRARNRSKAKEGAIEDTSEGCWVGADCGMGVGCGCGRGMDFFSPFRLIMPPIPIFLSEALGLPFIVPPIITPSVIDLPIPPPRVRARTVIGSMTKIDAHSSSLWIPTRRLKTDMILKIDALNACVNRMHL
jgi:hypothetical protein